MKIRFEGTQDGIILGNEDFVERIRDVLKNSPPNRELPALKRIQKSVSIDNIIGVVSEYFSLTGKDLTKRTRRYSKQRRVAIYLSRVMSRERNSVVAEHFGITPQAVSNVMVKVEAELEESNMLKRESEEIKCRLKV